MSETNYYQYNDNNSSIKQVEDGLAFILSHFNQNRLFSRKIMTKKLEYQKEVYSKEEVMKLFKESDLIDCRINAFPSFTEYKGIQRYPPDLIFIDLDKNNFKTEREFEFVLSSTLKNINEKLDGYPSVLFTGRGYHIYQPIDSFILQEINIFNEFENPSEKFLRFTKDFLSNNKADKSNYPSFKSCLLRIPFSYNSKCLLRGETIDGSQIKIIQKWNEVRPSIKYLLHDFIRYLIDEKIENELKSKRDSQKIQGKFSIETNEIKWIEKLLQIPLADYRKHTVSLILAPYLINIKKLSYFESFEIISGWLSKCNDLKQLNERFDDRIKRSLKTAIEKKIPPMKLGTLREKNSELYFILKIK